MNGSGLLLCKLTPEPHFASRKFRALPELRLMRNPHDTTRPFSHSSAGDEAAAAPEGQIGPEPGSQNSEAVAHTYQKSNMGRPPKPPCRSASHANSAEVRDRCLPPNRGKASIMAVAERRRRGSAAESSTDSSGRVRATLLRRRSKSWYRPAMPSIARSRIADDENFGPAGHPQIWPDPYPTRTIGLNTEPSPHRRRHNPGGPHDRARCDPLTPDISTAPIQCLYLATREHFHAKGCERALGGGRE